MEEGPLPQDVLEDCGEEPPERPSEGSEGNGRDPGRIPHQSDDHRCGRVCESRMAIKTLTVKSSTGRYHQVFHISRRAPWRAVANCGFAGTISTERRNEVPLDKVCKTCLKGPKKWIVDLFPEDAK